MACHMCTLPRVAAEPPDCAAESGPRGRGCTLRRRRDGCAGIWVFKAGAGLDESAHANFRFIRAGIVFSLHSADTTSSIKMIARLGCRDV